MTGELDDGQPLAGRVVEVMAASRGDTLVAWSEGRRGADLLLSAPLDQSQRPVTLGIGERLEVVWRDLGELHALPVALAAIDLGERPRWRLGIVGVLRRGQRREAVRAPLSVAVRVGPEPGFAEGTTVDVSEGGCRCILSARGPSSSPWGPDHAVPPAGLNTGAVVRVDVLFPEFTITCLSEVTHRHARADARVELSLRFIGLTEQQQDLIRRRVFARLRELRTRGLL
jgi:hypothetical protein